MNLPPVPRAESTDRQGVLLPPWRSWFSQLFLYVTNTISQGGIKVTSGSGSPNSSVTGSVGDLYVNTSGSSGTTLYVKESGTATNTGWVGK